MNYLEFHQKFAPDSTEPDSQDDGDMEELTDTSLNGQLIDSIK